MKYLDKEIYRRAAYETSSNMQQKWEVLYSQYWEQYALIKKDLPKQFTDYYEKKHLHDSRLFSFRLTREKNGGKPLSLISKWREYSGNTKFTIEYCGIEEFHCTNMGNYSLYPQYYIFGEILKTGDLLSHEFLMDTDVVYFIRFRELIFKI